MSVQAVEMVVPRPSKGAPRTFTSTSSFMRERPSWLEGAYSSWYPACCDRVQGRRRIDVSTGSRSDG